jgi:leader peptidase (prepilin peptidase)/N-methyltransferase
LELNAGLNGIMVIVAAFVGGACIGSFINATAMRTVAEKKWWGNERSVCDTCGHELCARDLVPILSYSLLGGKCRYCGAKIGIRHFAAEIISGLLTAALAVRWGPSLALALSLVILWLSLFNSMTDMENGFIYDVPAVALGIVGLGLRLAGGWPAVLEGILGAALGFGFIALIILIKPGGMGWGDAMLMIGIGGAVGWKYCIFCLYFGFLIGGIVILPLMLKKKLKRKDAVPLGPFLAIGSLLTLFTGNVLVSRFAALIGSYPGWPWG